MFDLEGNDLVWKNKTSLPAANEENQKLEESLKKKKIEVEQLKAKLDKNIDTAENMKQYFSRVFQTLNYKQQLYKSREHELELEQTAKKIINRDCSRLNQEIKAANHEIDSLRQRQKMKEVALAQQMEKKEKLKSAIQFDETAFLQYLQKSMQLEEDNMALLKYTAADNSKIKELELLIEKLSKEAYEKKSALQDTDTEAFIMQSEMDRMYEEFQKAHIERKNIISNWENVINQTEQRNDEINKLSQYIIRMRGETLNLEHRLKEEQQLLTIEKSRNDALELDIKEKDKFCTKLRNAANDGRDREKDLEAEAETARNISNYLSYQKQALENELKGLDQQILKKNNKLEELEKTCQKVEKDIENLVQKTYGANQCAAELEQFLHHETEKLFKEEKEFSSIQQDILILFQDVNNIKAEQKALTTQKESCELTNRNNSSKLSALDNSRNKQLIEIQDIEYNLEKIQQRIKKMEGDTAEDDRQRELEVEKNRLLDILNEKLSAYKIVKEEVKGVMEKINVATKGLELNKKINSALAEEISCVELYSNNSQKLLKCSISRKQELLVQESLLKFQIKRFQNILKSHNKSVLSLQKDKAEFEAMMKERLNDLKICTDMFQTDIRAEEEECSIVKQKLYACTDKVLKLQTKYQVTLGALGVTDSVEKIQVELLVNAENEKCMFQSERDTLISSVFKNEDELAALNNTLWLIHANNEQFRQAIYPVGMSLEDIKHLKSLEFESQSLAMELHMKSNELDALKESICEKENNLSHLNERFSELQQVVNDRGNDNERLCKDLDDIQNKLCRADKNNSRLCLELLANDEYAGIEQDVKIHLHRELRRNLSDILFACIESEPSISFRLQKIYNEENVPLPARARRLTMSRNSSQMSSTSRQISLSNRSSTSGVSAAYTSSSASELRTPTVISLGSDFQS